MSAFIRDQQDLDVPGSRILKRSDVDYKINGMYIRNKGKLKNEQATRDSKMTR